MSQEWGEEVFDDVSGAGFDFGGDGHAGAEADQAVVDLHTGFGERDAGGIDEFLAGWFA